MKIPRQPDFILFLKGFGTTISELLAYLETDIG